MTRSAAIPRKKQNKTTATQKPQNQNKTKKEHSYINNFGAISEKITFSSEGIHSLIILKQYDLTYNLKHKDWKMLK